MKFDIKALGLASGILWAAGVLLLGLTSTYLSWGNEWVDLLGSVYIGYKVGLFGAITGAIWAFVDGLIGGIVFAWLYNKFSK